MEKDEKKIAGIYIRVSTEDQARGVPWKYQCGINTMIFVIV